MGDILSQAEIDALLNGSYEEPAPIEDSAVEFSEEEADALGEIGNISMGTSATTLFTLLGQKVLITTPQVSVTTWSELATQQTNSHVGVQVEYTEGLRGMNLLILKETDTKIITDLMMGGDGSNTAGELSELHLSAIGEAMNQMIGSASTSMSSMFDKRIDISPPRAFMIDFGQGHVVENLDEHEKLVKIAFRMVIGDLVDSEIMQLIPLEFAKAMASNLLQINVHSAPTPIIMEPAAKAPEPPPAQRPQSVSTPQPQMQPVQPMRPEPQPVQRITMPPPREPIPEPEYPRNPVNVQYAQFESFEESRYTVERENINLIMDVPLEITVELGRTQRLIRDILEFAPGSIIELDKLAGEPIDILVNGKVIAKGEVVVIDESFGVRITDIVSPSKRL